MRDSNIIGRWTRPAKPSDPNGLQMVWVFREDGTFETNCLSPSTISGKFHAKDGKLVVTTDSQAASLNYSVKGSSFSGELMLSQDGGQGFVFKK